jgi:taurine dioxygenase
MTVHEAYNAAAIKTAEKLHAARQTEKKSAAELPLEAVFPSFNRAGLGVALEYERMGNRPVSAALQAQADAFGYEFEHLGITIGTVIHNIDLHQSLSAEQVQFVRDTLLERKVIFFRDQHLDETEQVAFGRCFGELDAFPFGKPGEDPYILEIVHGLNRPGTENGWHTDVTWMEAPSLGSIAQCVVVPPVGGDTLFADSHACYLGMPEALQAEVEHLHAVHDYNLFMQGLRAAGVTDDIAESIKQDIPFGVSHPLLRTHPETGKTALYIHGGFLRHDSLFDSRTSAPLAKAESVRISRELLKQHDRPEYVCRFKWTAGSIAFWDNRAVQHYAASDYYPHDRLLRRVTVAGDKPYYQGATNHAIAPASTS